MRKLKGMSGVSPEAHLQQQFYYKHAHKVKAMPFHVWNTVICLSQNEKHKTILQTRGQKGMHGHLLIWEQITLN